MGIDFYLVIKITKKWSRFGIWVLVSFYDQDSDQDYLKVVKIWDFGIYFFFTFKIARKQDWGFGY